MDAPSSMCRRTAWLPRASQRAQTSASPHEPTTLLLGWPVLREDIRPGDDIPCNLEFRSIAPAPLHGRPFGGTYTALSVQSHAGSAWPSRDLSGSSHRGEEEEAISRSIGRSGARREKQVTAPLARPYVDPALDRLALSLAAAKDREARHWSRTGMRPSMTARRPHHARPCLVPCRT